MNAKLNKRLALSCVVRYLVVNEKTREPTEKVRTDEAMETIRKGKASEETRRPEMAEIGTRESVHHSSQHPCHNPPELRIAYGTVRRLRNIASARASLRLFKATFNSMALSHTSHLSKQQNASDFYRMDS